MVFDPDDLKPIDELKPYENPMGGDQGGTHAGTGGSSASGQSHQTFVDPEGRKVLRIVLPNGHESYAVETGSKTAEIHVKQKDGTFSSQDWEKRGALETVLGDEKFMTFLAITGAGVAASAYAGAGAAGTSGMSAGEIAALEAGDVAVGGGGVASNTVPGVLQSGAVATPVTQGAIEVGAIGTAPATTLPAASVTAPPVSPPVAPPGGNGLDPSYLDKVLNFAKTPGGGQIVGGIISGIGSALLSGNKDGGGDTEAMLDKRLAHEAAENDKQRAHAGRNFQGSSYAKIDWGEQPKLTTEMPVMRNTGPSNPLNVKTSQLGVLERRRRDGR